MVVNPCAGHQPEQPRADVIAESFVWATASVGAFVNGGKRSEFSQWTCTYVRCIFRNNYLLDIARRLPGMDNNRFCGSAHSDNSIDWLQQNLFTRSLCQ